MSALKFDLERYNDKQRTIPLDITKTSPPCCFSDNFANLDVGSPLCDKSYQSELQKLLQGFPSHQSPKVTAFGVSPPVRNGRNGGAQNPLTSDPRWQTLAPTFARRNLQAIRIMERQHLSSRNDLENLFQNYQFPSIPRVEPTHEKEDCPFACEVRYFDSVTNDK